ncbi:MAG TPA: filamentous hemagglutinin N-terminal domain-containing protein [Candidatus Eisenbacteria bacterium]|nr:filamentous hemagglutinin N-terminal domain-containing protein [Candidatus Eisenbacteria bacterium]
MKTVRRFQVLLAVWLVPLFCGPAFANPSFSSADSGSIQIEENGSTYNIYSSDRAIGSFNSFGNAAGETINSVQASPDYTALFRVVGNEPSVFYGALNANSRIFLINQNGIVFGEGSQINAAGLVASTLDIANGDFLQGRYAFERDSLYAPGYILNQGELVAQNGGYIALLGGSVKNEGVIRADGGSAVLASGDGMLVSLDGQGLVSVQVDGAVREAVYDLSGQKINDALANSGEIRADGGKVILSAKAAEEVFDNTINHTGVIEARSASVVDGEILLDGGGEGVVRVSGVLDASGTGAGETGGTVRVLGDKIGLVGDAKIDVSGDAGGGTALVGGDTRGEGGVPTASYVFAGSDSSIRADALTSGDGGKVILWSDLATRAYGTVSARGGALSGDGGFVETSGHYLEITNPVDVSAPNGFGGTWLLDPEDVEITNAGGGAPSNITQSGAGDPGPILFAPTADNLVTRVDVAALNAALDAGSNVVVSTASTGTAAGTITVTSAILKSADGGNADGSTLTLSANSQIVVNNTITSSSGLLRLVLTGPSGVTINANIDTNGGTFDSSGSTLTVADAATVFTRGGLLTANHSAAVTINGTLDTAAGGLSLTGSAITLDDGALTATTGAMTLTSAGAILTQDATNAAGEIDTGGNVTMTATSFGTTTNHLQIEGDSSANSSLSITNNAAAASDNFVDVLTDEFSAVSLSFTDAETNFTLSLPAGDSVTIAGAAALSTLNATLTGTTPDFTYGLTETQTVAIGNVQGGSGDVNVTSAARLDVGTVGTTGDVTLTATAGPVTDANGAANNITATSLSITSNTGADLDTTVTNLTVSNTGPGNVNIDEADGANLLDVQAADGDVTVTTAAGNLAVSNVVATGATLTATAGAITDANGAVNNITADTLTATAATGINLDTTVISMSATTTGAGSILLDEADDVTLTNISAANGPITITAAGPVTATRVFSLTDNDANDISITTGGNLTVGELNAGTVFGDITLDASFGAIARTGGSTNLTGDQVSLTSSGDIGSPAAPVSYTANNFTFNILGVGTAYVLAFNGGVLDTTLSSGDLVFSTTGDILIRSAGAFTGNINLTAGGSILSVDGSSLLTAFNDIRLVAGGTIGTASAPLRFVSLMGGSLFLSAGGQTQGLSIHLSGNLPRENVFFSDTPPGLVVYNDFLLGGGGLETLAPSTVSTSPEQLPIGQGEYASSFTTGFSPADFAPGFAPPGGLIQIDLPDSSLSPEQYL